MAMSKQPVPALIRYGGRNVRGSDLFGRNRTPLSLTRRFFKGLKYPASLTLGDIKHECPAFGGNVCPFAKLSEEKKGMAAKCPAFESGCPFKDCGSVGEFQGKLGQMRDQCKGDAAYVEFLRGLTHTAMVKEVDMGTKCPIFQTKGGCPFAKDTEGKPITTPDFLMTPWVVSWNDIMVMCPAFGKGMCPYEVLVDQAKGLAGKCPAFKAGCPFKGVKTVGEMVEKEVQMRVHCPAKAAHEKFFKMLLAVTEEGQKKMGACPFNKVSPFANDTQGKPIIPK